MPCRSPAAANATSWRRTPPDRPSSGGKGAEAPCLQRLDRAPADCAVLQCTPYRFVKIVSSFDIFAFTGQTAGRPGDPVI
jgi:hypothetical protein